MVETEEPEIGLCSAPTRCLQNLWESSADSPPRIRKPGESHPTFVGFDQEGPGLLEDMEVLMSSQPPMGNARPLVIPRYHHDGDPRLGDVQEWLKSLENQGRGYARSVEHVPTVYDDVNLTLCRFSKGCLIGRQEVVATSTPFHPWSSG
jgi:hypothetical protein